MSKIAITGSSGFLGSNLVRVLSERDLLLIERIKRDNHNEREYFYTNIDSKACFHDALLGCRTVIHCAARTHVMSENEKNPLAAYREVNTLGTLNLAKQAAKSGVERFIFISSIKVNGENTSLGYPYTSSDKPHFKDYYGQSKFEAESGLKKIAEETGMEVVIIRPPLVYGPGVKANFTSLMNLVNKGIPLPFKCISNNKRSLVSVTNLADLIVTCIDHPKAANQVFLVSDDKDLSTSEIVKYMAASLDKVDIQLPLPISVFRLFGKLFGKTHVCDRLLGSLQVDISHTKVTLGWVPPQTLQDGFKQTAEAFLHSKK